FRNEKWEHTIPIQVGFGNAWYEHREYNGISVRENYKPVILYEPAMTTQYKLVPWFGVGVGIGYRVLLLNNRNLNENLNSPVYVFRLKVFFGEIYRSLTKISAGKNSKTKEVS